MKLPPIPPDLPDSDAFIREVHQVEEKINDYLSRRRREAEALLGAARADAEALSSEGEEAARMGGQLVAEEMVVLARAEAAATEASGREAVGRLACEVGPRRETARALLFDLLLGRAR